MADGSFSPKNWFHRETASKPTESPTPEEQRRARIEAIAAPFKHAFGQYAHEFSNIYYDLQNMPEPSWGLKREFLQACSTITNGALSAKDLQKYTNVIQILVDMWHGLRSKDHPYDIADAAVAEVYGAPSSGHNESHLLALNSRQANDARRAIINASEGASALSGHLERIASLFSGLTSQSEDIRPQDRLTFLSREFPILFEEVEALQSLTTTKFMQASAALIKKEQATHRHDALAWKHFAGHIETILDSRTNAMLTLVLSDDIPDVLVKERVYNQKKHLAEIDADIKKYEQAMDDVIFNIESYQALKLLGNKTLSEEQKMERCLFVESYKALASLLPKDVDALLRATNPADFKRIVDSMQQDLKIRRASPEIKGSSLYEHRLVASIDLKKYAQAVFLLENLIEKVVRVEQGMYQPAGYAGDHSTYPIHHRHTVQESIEYINTRHIHFYKQRLNHLRTERAKVLDPSYVSRKRINDTDLHSLQALLLEPASWKDALADLQSTLKPYKTSLPHISSRGETIYSTWQHRRTTHFYRIDPIDIDVD